MGSSDCNHLLFNRGSILLEELVMVWAILFVSVSIVVPFLIVLAASILSALFDRRRLK